MITKTIGGDRLGSGKKMKQSFHNFERSNHDLSYLWRSTIAPGVLVPFLSEPLLPGDSFDIKLNTDTMTHPTVGPLFGSYKLQLDIFMIPIRLYQAQLHNNKLNIGMDMSQIKLPLLNVTTNNIDFDSSEPIDIQQINPSSLLSYLDIKGLGQAADDGADVWANFNGIPYLAYYDIYKNYYANKQEEIGAFISYDNPPIVNITREWVEGPGGVSNLPVTASEQMPILRCNGTNLDINNLEVKIATAQTEFNTIPLTDFCHSLMNQVNPATLEDNISGVINVQYWATATGYPIITDIAPITPFSTTPAPQIKTFPLTNIDDMREDILEKIKTTTPFKIGDVNYAPYRDNINKLENTIGSRIRSYLPMQGLALKTYQSDLFNNWISTEWIDGENGIAAITSIDVSSGLLNLDTLNLSKKVYNMLNRISISGGSYYDWIEAVYTEEGFKSAETPMYMGGLSKEIIFQEVVSNSAAEGEPLGTLAGRGVQSGKHKGGHITVKSNGEPCYVMGIVSLTPRIDYSQGNKWDTTLETLNDFHKPALDGIGYQDLITNQMAFWDTKRDDDGTPIYRSAGKQPAWINYMTNVNKTYGLFADSRNEMFMTLNRRYEADARNKTIADLTTYIDPAKFNYIFAQTDRGAQNFWLQIAIDISARRKVSARQIPNL